MRKMIRKISFLAVIVLVMTSAEISCALVQKEDFQIILEPAVEYQNLFHFVDEIFIAMSKSGENRLIDSSGKELSSHVYNSIYSLEEGLAVAGTDGKYGYINKTGEPVIPLLYEHAAGFSEGLAAVAQNGKYGYIDSKGNVAVPLLYEDADYFSEGLAAVKLNGQYGYINTSGEVCVPFEYDHADTFSQGRAHVVKNEKHGYIDIQGNVIIAIDHDDNWPYDTHYKNGLTVVSKNRQYGYVDINGIAVTGLEFNFAYPFHEGYGIAVKDGKWGAIDSSGSVVVPFEYDDMLYCFSNERAAVMKGGKWGYVDPNGNIIAAMEYDEALEFYEGYARIQKNGKYGFIDTEGRLVVPTVYDNAYSFENGLAIVETMDGSKIKTGLLNTAGEIVLSLDYLTIRIGDDGWVTASKDGKWGIFKTKTYEATEVSVPQLNREHTATPNSAKTLIANEHILFSAYEIKGYNYIKLRDLAQVLNGTEKQFSVNWDSEQQAIRMESGQPYIGDGQTTSVAFNGNVKPAFLSNALLYLDGNEVTAEAYNIDGNTWFKLRDLGDILGFLVEWDSQEKIIKIELNRPT